MSRVNQKNENPCLAWARVVGTRFGKCKIPSFNSGAHMPLHTVEGSNHVFFPDLMAHLRCMVSSHVQSSNAKKHVKASGLWKDSYPTINRLKYIAATSAMQSYPLTSYKTVHVITHHLCDPSQWIIPPSQWSACGATWECSWANPTIGLQNIASVVLQCINYNDWCIHIHNLQ